MTYVFDTSSFIVLGHYFPERFPSFWDRFEQAVSEGKIVSVREVLRELETEAAKPHLQEWIGRNKRVFLTPSQAETEFVAQIFGVHHFQHMIEQKRRLKGGPAADPFVIAAARVRGGYVVTEETDKPNAARIPNVCRHFDIRRTNLEGFMKMESWRF
jgi:hypothetical protein